MAPSEPYGVTLVRELISFGEVVVAASCKSLASALECVSLYA